jgi:hypothetical protein
MFDALNACAMISNAMPDDAHDEVRRDRALVERYDAARAARDRAA